MSRPYEMEYVQDIPSTLEEVWTFFSSPANLKIITPPYMDFKIISPEQETGIYAGQLIRYKIRPVLRIPVHWVTQITQVKKNVFFTDEQRSGPYKLWHHEHHFRQLNGKVEMRDLVIYELPLGFLGSFAHGLFVKKQLEGIFNYRRKRIGELFGTPR